MDTDKILKMKMVAKKIVAILFAAPAILWFVFGHSHLSWWIILSPWLLLGVIECFILLYGLYLYKTKITITKK